MKIRKIGIDLIQFVLREASKELIKKAFNGRIDNLLD
ncbi:hypothetical protein ES705_30136 [subsurface metagenome]